MFTSNWRYAFLLLPVVLYVLARWLIQQGEFCRKALKRAPEIDLEPFDLSYWTALSSPTLRDLREYHRQKLGDKITIVHHIVPLIDDIKEDIRRTAKQSVWNVLLAMAATTAEEIAPSVQASGTGGTNLTGLISKLPWDVLNIMLLVFLLTSVYAMLEGLRSQIRKYQAVL